MTEEELLQRLKEIDDFVSGDEYPQTHQLLNFARMHDFETEFRAPMDFALLFQEADTNLPMPAVVGDFLIDVYQEEVENGSAEAANNLGALYYSGRGGVTDYNKALELYALAAARGDVAASDNLGFFYYDDGEYEKAFQYFAIGAFTGRLISMCMIGDMYRYGRYVEKNEKEAFSIYCQAFQENHIRSDEDGEQEEDPCFAELLMRLGDCFAQGIGTEVNEERALYLYQNASIMFLWRRNPNQNYQYCVMQADAMRKNLEEALR